LLLLREPAGLTWLAGELPLGLGVVLAGCLFSV